MEFVRLTEEEKKEVLNNLDSKEKDALQITESILQKIAGIYINRAGYHPEMADLYRYVAGTMSELAMEIGNGNYSAISPVALSSLRTKRG